MRLIHSISLGLLCGLLLLSGARAFNTVVLDAGHGGSDLGGIPGRRGPIYEKDLTLDMALRIRPLLEASGMHVVMTRTTDVFVSLPERSAIANHTSNSIFVSIHFDAYTNKRASGTTTYFNTTSSHRLAELVHEERLAVLGRTIPSRGVKYQNYAVLIHTHCPAILCELGFLTNASERDYLADPSFRQKMAAAIVRGIVRYRTGAPHSVDT